MVCLRLLLVMALGLGAEMARAATLIAVDNANPPFMYLHNGQVEGLYPRLLQRVFERLGEPVTFQALPWKRALALGESGSTGIGGIYKNAQREQLYDFSAPLLEERILVYVRQDQRFDFQGIADLHGRRVGVIRGWTYSEAFDQAAKQGHIQVKENASDASNFKMLASGRLDAVLAIEQAGQYSIRRLHLPQIVALEQPLNINPTYLVFAKSAHRQALLTRVDQILSAMREDGSLTALVQDSLAAE
ncbi:MAG: transporter substrate-binding domain-containing protein [Pseudomonas sp.]|uniref:substrate-binding periplasmic protein n=1 Tax=Pseudomonas sp. TaxID=306 RepID=UPI003396B7EE